MSLRWVAAIAAVAFAGALAAWTAPAARAQTTTRAAKLHAYVTYGLDRQRIRLDRVARVPRIDGRAYVRTVDPGDGRMGYLILTLTVANVGDAPTTLPTLVPTLAMDAGPAIAPAVAGPFVNGSTLQADGRATIPPHRSETLYLALIDVPNGRTVTALTVSPNDATAQYRFALRPVDVRALPVVPRR